MKTIRGRIVQLRYLRQMLRPGRWVQVQDSDSNGWFGIVIKADKDSLRFEMYDPDCAVVKSWRPENIVSFGDHLTYPLATSWVDV